MKQIYFLPFAALVLDMLRFVAVAFVIPRQERSSTFLLSTSNFWKQWPGESSTDFYKRIQQASSDPVAFEKFVSESRRTERQETSQPVPSEESDLVDTGEQKSGYQRAEDWEADQSKRVSGWDEKIQFDGKRFGNGFNQNEILRRHLKGF